MARSQGHKSAAQAASQPVDWAKGRAELESLRPGPKSPPTKHAGTGILPSAIDVLDALPYAAALTDDRKRILAANDLFRARLALGMDQDLFGKPFESIWVGPRCQPDRNAISWNAAPDGGYVVILTDPSAAQGAEAQHPDSFLNSPLLRTMIEQIPMAVALKDARDFRILLINQRGADTIGLSPEEIIGKTDSELTDPQTSARRLKDDRMVVETRKPLKLPQLRYRSKDGNERVLSSYKIPILDERNVVRYVMAIGEDITKLHDADLALRRDRKIWRDFARTAREWMWQSDADMRLCWPPFETTRNGPLNRNSVVGKTREELTLPEDLVVNAEKWRDYQQTVEERRSFHDFVYPTRAASGKIHHISISGIPLFDDTGKFLGYRGTATDVTERVDAEESANEAHARLSEALEASPTAFFIYDRDLHLVLANRASKEDFYADVADVMQPGTSLRTILQAMVDRKLIQTDDPSAFVESRIAACRGAGSQMEVNYVDGRVIQLSVRPTKDGGAVVNSVDITAMRDRERQLRESEQEAHRIKEAAEAANRAKSDFLANMSHELRTPLNAIIGFAEIMRDEMFGPVENEHYAEYITDIHTSASHLLTLIADILDMSRVEAGRLELYETDFPIESAMQSAIRLVEKRAEKGNLTIETRLADPFPRLYADERKVKQILINLLTNAVKFTHPGGQIVVAADVAVTGEIILSVSDNGIGVKEEDLERIMVPFGQVENSLSRRHDGSGLGLPLTRALVELHGGTMSFDSEYGVGTTVSVRFPAARSVR